MDMIREQNEFSTSLSDVVARTELKNRSGMYSVGDVDRYIKKLQLAAQKMENASKARLEQMVEFAKSLSNERDVTQAKNEALEKKIENLRKGLFTEPEKRGLKVISIADYNKLTSQNYDNGAFLRMGQRGAASDDGVGNGKLHLEVERLKDLLTQKDMELRSKTGELDALRKWVKEAEPAGQNNKTASALAELRYKIETLQLELQRMEDENKQLKAEKDKIDKTFLDNKEIWKKDQDALLRRYKVLLSAQKQSMQRLQHGVDQTVKYMESLGDSAKIEIDNEEV